MQFKEMYSVGGKKTSYPSLHVFRFTMNSTKEIFSTVHLYGKYSETSIKFQIEILFCTHCVLHYIHKTVYTLYSAK